MGCKQHPHDRALAVDETDRRFLERPVKPVDREFCWMSATDARHTRHVVARPQVSMVIVDSTVLPYHGRAVYAVGEAGELSGSNLDRALEVYPRPDGQDATPVMRADVTAPALYRLFQATASDMWASEWVGRYNQPWSALDASLIPRPPSFACSLRPRRRWPGSKRRGRCDRSMLQQRGV
jgi:hypothetical protein